MLLPIAFGFLYLVILIFSLVRKEWRKFLKRWTLVIHFAIWGLAVVDILLMWTNDLSFRGVYADRIIVLGLILSGGLSYSLFKHSSIATRAYFGAFLYYPIVAAATFFVDRIFFVIISGPILMSLLIPEIFYSDWNFEIRQNTGLLVARRLTLVEKNWLVEKDIGHTEYLDGEEAGIKNIEVLNTTKDSVNVKIEYQEETKIVTFRL